MKKQISALAASLAALAAVAPSTVQAAVLIDIKEIGSDVVVTTSGTFDTTGLTILGNAVLDPIHTRIINYYGMVIAGSGPTTVYQGSFSSLSAFGPAGTVYPTFSSGDPFFLRVYPRNTTGELYLPHDYAGGPISNSMTFSGQSFASLGFNEGTYVTTGPNDTVTFQIGALAGAVPEPATWAFMIFGFGAIGGAMRRQRKANVKVGYA